MTFGFAENFPATFSREIPTRVASAIFFLNGKQFLSEPYLKINRVLLHFYAFQLLRLPHVVERKRSSVKD